MFRIVLNVLNGNDPGADVLRHWPLTPSLSVITSLATSFQPGEGGLPCPGAAQFL